MTLRSIQPTPLVEQAAAQLREQITGGAWPVGTKLPGETTLAASLGVGRSTVREAIRALAGEGLLQPRQGAGVFVLATESRTDLADHLRKASLADLYEVRMMIETRAARLAAERRTPADAAALEAALERRTRAARRSDEEFVEADVALHTAVVAAAGNPVLTALFEQFVPTLREALADLVRRSGRADENLGHAAHAALVAAVAEGNPDRAETVVSEEIASTPLRRVL
ncbi:GntR family transcriptional repressor for pyruvate dehydrogenase complex [Catenulispora sp. GAS73]|uniref:FadR/GntR family transcriptional regulator n=1 Tax=Catenulispora sp. GAS73 TaxID=3156269 RepID=UPI003512730E